MKFAAGRNHGNRAPWPEFIRRAATTLEWEPTAKSPDLQEPREWGAGIPIKYARNQNPRKRVFVNPDTKKMVVRKCDENDKDALRWCIAKTDKRKSRKVTSKIFSAKMYELMGWNTACRYKILGHKIVYEDEMLYIFDLLETEIFLDVRKTETQKAGVQAFGFSQWQS